MSSKRYEYKLLESSELTEFEQQLTAAGGEGWAAVGYGVLPSGSRSALMQRKQQDHSDHHHHEHGEGHHHDRPHRDRERM